MGRFSARPFYVRGQLDVYGGKSGESREESITLFAVWMDLRAAGEHLRRTGREDAVCSGGVGQLTAPRTRRDWPLCACYWRI